MLSESKKKAIVLTLALSALAFDIIATFTGPVIVPLARKASTILFHTTRLLILCGLIYSVGAGAASIAITLFWKPGHRVLKVFVILLSVIAIGHASYWLLGLYAIAHLNP
jgi:hypothetical protein